MIKNSWAEDIAEEQIKITGFLKNVYLFCMGFMRGDAKALNREQSLVAEPMARKPEFNQ